MQSDLGENTHREASSATVIPHEFFEQLEGYKSKSFDFRDADGRIRTTRAYAFDSQLHQSEARHLTA